MHSARVSKMLRRAAAGLRHAFATAEPELTAEEKAVLDEAAALIAKKKLGGPASFLLESSRPLNFVASQMLAFLEPFLAGPLGARRFGSLRGALEKRSSIDYLLRAIDRHEERGGAPAASNHTDAKAPRS